MEEAITKSDFESLLITNSLNTALKTFAKTANGIIPIINNDGYLEGILTKNRVIQALANDNQLDQPIQPFINTNPICLSPESTSSEIRFLFLKHSISHAPVVNSQNQPIGVISTPHILKRWQKRFESLQSQLKVIDKIDAGFVTVNEQMKMIAVNPIARGIFQTDISYDFSHITERYPTIGQLIKDTIYYKKEFSKQRIKVNEFSLLIQCIPLFEKNKFNSVMLLMKKLPTEEKYTHISNWNEKLRTALEVTDEIDPFADAITLVNKEGVVKVVNKSFCNLFSSSEEEIIGESIFDKIPDLNIQEAFNLGVPLKGLNRLIGTQKSLIYSNPIKDGNQIIGTIFKIIYKGLEKIQSDVVKAPLLQKKEQNISGTKYSFNDIIGKSTSIKEVKKEAFVSSQSRSTVLILGENGTGKELFAHGIHVASSRSGPFIKVNCAAIPDELLEAEFFGYEDGAFTGAKRGGKKGKFELAQQGTLFLDEIGDMSLSLQSKLLRVLQEKEFEPVGSNRTIQIQMNSKIITATNQNIKYLVKTGRFREDLYYRINVFPLNIPPLRERKEDIPLIIDFLIERLNHEGFSLKGVTSESHASLIEYNWPGNVRELQNVLERGANLTTDGYIDIGHLPNDIRNLEKHSHHDYLVSHDDYRTDTRGEKELIINILHQAQGNKVKASKMLGRSRTWLYKKMDKYNIILD
ncbi:sigma-54-dependent Fis family transcriptional regulator [Salicibibacter kimchii]|uniref:CBS domain-containing protein n=1 Tax=Salicibibacter kimchii TaxID=2099786 RepID=A0A345BW32_9BACI|nr:sigma-54-dependent Fis family transcriptional regulator [Salicibibacter kimchii]AXF55163.1 CBS domain-containing protein [Salicibibacter kimchii]